ncbi:PAS domain S-box protein [uncultured Desulfosarcina sp.]|uniref:hybrid sensor histidine kinase/response regulator n=1 Tax=uncultured Desulfosarcina sp. TaxID=218289 RepID=UPI0029C669BF|nr:PAS domain S-box protein [uncultured Desulfosarcina sp.]
MKPPMSLRHYLSLQFAIVAALPIVVIAILVWQFLMPQMRTNIGIQHESMARAIAGQISGYLMGGDRQLVAVAKFVESQGSHPSSQLASLLDAQCGNGELFETIYIVVNRDDTISSVGLAHLRRSKRDDLLGMDLSGRRFIDMARQLGKAAWSETFLSTASSRMAVALTVPMTDSVIVGEITLDKLSEVISHLPAEAGLLTLVLDQQGRIVADSQRFRWGQQLSLSALPASVPDGKAPNTSSSFELHGRTFLGTMVDVHELGWKVLVAQPIENAFKPLRAAFLMISLGLGAALILALTVAWFQANGLSGLFRSYGDKAQAISRGDYELQWPTSKTAEFMNLGQSLKHMAQMINQREIALVSSETRMRIILDSIGDAVIATDANGAVTRINPMAEKLTGWSSVEANGRHLTEVFQIVNAHTRQTVANPVDKVLSRGEIVGLANHTMLIARDGQEYQIADSGAPIRHPDGRIVGVVLVFRDVTEAYSREQRIRENEKLLKDITANVPGVVFQFKSTPDHAYSTTYVSEKAAEIFELQPGPQTFLEAFRTHIPEDEINRFTTSIHEAVDKVKPWHYEGRFIKRTGKKIWFSGNAIPHQEGDTLVFYGMLMDITWRKQLEESLRLTQFCFDNASIGIFWIDGKGQILNVNEQGCRSLGYSREELCAMTVFDIDPNFIPDIWPEHIENLRNLKTRSIETLHKHKNGNVFPVQIMINIMAFEDHEFHVAYVQDISDRKHAEKEAKRLGAALLQAQKMEAIGTLAGGIAHDFNNILSAVIGFSELSLPMAAPDAPIHQYLQQILTAGLRARDLVQQILTFSRKDERQLGPLQVPPLVKEALKMLRSSLPATIEICPHINPEVNPVLADPTQIHQIVMNLCTNAAHAMETEGGRLDVFISQVRLSDRDIRLHPGLLPGAYLKLSIQDTGRGIPPEIMQKIYDPYFTTKEKGKGTGLGLSVVHGIVQSYGGAIHAYSEPNCGTTFNVYIPTVENRIDAEKKENLELPIGNEHLLLVDDEPTLIDVGRQLLEKLGYRVSTAEGSTAALERFRNIEPPIDLVLTDMTMPKMTGDKLAIELLKIKPDLPIILATGYSVAITPEKALKMGIKAFVHKPIVEADLAKIVRNVLDEGKKTP